MLFHYTQVVVVFGVFIGVIVVIVVKCCYYCYLFLNRPLIIGQQ